MFFVSEKCISKVTIPGKNGPLKIHLEVTILTDSLALHFVQNKLKENKKDLLLVSDLRLEVSAHLKELKMLW